MRINYFKTTIATICLFKVTMATGVVLIYHKVRGKEAGLPPSLFLSVLVDLYEDTSGGNLYRLGTAKYPRMHLAPQLLTSLNTDFCRYQDSA